MVTHDWRADDLPADILKGATLCSGMYDLKPVRLSKRSKYVKFTDEMEEALSAQRHLDRLNLPLVLAYGTYETPEFQRQTRDFARGGEGGRQARRAPGRRRLQSFRDAGDAGKSLRPARPRGAGADGLDAGGVEGREHAVERRSLSWPGHAAGAGRRRRRRARRGRPALAQRAAQPPRAKGPLVWLDMDQKELDDAYDQAVYAPNRATCSSAAPRNSELVRERLGAPKRFAYGAGPIEALDVFTTKAANAPINVFVHGGAWRAGLATDYAYAAEMFVNAGAHYVVLDFNNVARDRRRSDADGASRCAARVAWVYKQRRELRRRSRAASTSAAIRRAGTSPACC